jgi:hypothetical protein
MGGWSRAQESSKSPVQLSHNSRSYNEARQHGYPALSSSSRRRIIDSAI